MRIARGILAFLLGYAVVVLTTEFGFRLLPKRPIHSGEPLIIAAAALVALTAGFTGGALATRLARSRIAGFAVLAPLVAETIWLLFFRTSDWLDALAALALLGAVGVGSWVGGGVTRDPVPSRSG
jgi:hypothetical protein